MEKIKLANNKKLTLDTNGIEQAGDILILDLIPEGTLSELYDTLSDKKATAKIILLSESGEELAVYGGFTTLQSLAIEGGVRIHVVLEKPNEITSRLEYVEEQITDAQIALCDLYEMIG